MRLPTIAISMGDPAGIGPELCLKALSNAELRAICLPVIYGDCSILRQVEEKCGPRVELTALNDGALIGSQNDRCCVVENDNSHQLENVGKIIPGVINEVTGRASFGYVEGAIRDALAGHVDSVVTCPINKEAWNAAGIKYPGHTELFAEQFSSDQYCMMMTSDRLSCSLVTTHIGYAEVPCQLTTARIEEVIQLSHDALFRMRGRPPKIVVLGLNPHAGENGLFGNQEEQKVILPAIETARTKGIDVVGPLPPDTAFLPARLRETDCHVCMYHDQGLIPFKTLAFDIGVNVTLGLSSVRTSVDHGTALDIAWTGQADPSSLYSAIKLAARLATDEPSD